MRGFPNIRGFFREGAVSLAKQEMPETKVDSLMKDYNWYEHLEVMATPAAHSYPLEEFSVTREQNQR